MANFTKIITMIDTDDGDKAIARFEVTLVQYKEIKKVQNELNASSAISVMLSGVINHSNIYAYNGEEITEDMNLSNFGELYARLEEMETELYADELHIKFPFKDVSGALSGEDSISVKELDEVFSTEAAEDVEDENEHYCEFCAMETSFDDHNNCEVCGNHLGYTEKQCSGITNETLVSSSQINLGVEVVDSDTEIKNPFNADFDRCPKCESNDIDWGELDPDNVLIYREHRCNNCGTKWEEKYELTRVIITEGDVEKIEGSI